MIRTWVSFPDPQAETSQVAAMVLIFYAEQRSEKGEHIFRLPQTNASESNRKHFSSVRLKTSFETRQHLGDMPIRNFLGHDTVFTGRSNISFDLMDAFIAYSPPFLSHPNHHNSINNTFPYPEDNGQNNR